ncbi:MAG: hypothetical protein HS126_21515 [Anaerolineales bacterium]|nr:hypothetical protein [Anaerolineales bacterium]
MTTAAAIDRVVHHNRIIEFGPEMTSVRAEEAARRQLQNWVRQGLTLPNQIYGYQFHQGKIFREAT